MMTLSINGKEYKVKFGYNCFCDTDLLDRVNDATRIFSGEEDVSNMSEEELKNRGFKRVKNLFDVVRDLLFVGFKKYNPVETKQEIGDLIDDYIDEDTDGKRGIKELFNLLEEELISRGFLNEILGNPEEPTMENGAKKPTDHKKKQA